MSTCLLEHLHQTVRDSVVFWLHENAAQYPSVFLIGLDIDSSSRKIINADVVGREMPLLIRGTQGQLIEYLDLVTVNLRCRTSPGEVSHDVEFGFLQRLHI